MEDCKELMIEADTFEKLRRDTNIVLQKALGTMKDKGSMDGKVSIALDIKMVSEYIPNFDPEVEGETRQILKPKFEHKVTSAINIKNEEKGGINPEMAMVWDEDTQSYVLRYINNTDQRSMFDTDFQGVMNPDDGTVEDAAYSEVLGIDGEVADEGALPGPVADGNLLEDSHSDEGNPDNYGYEDVV